jgi:5,10-methylenetetrahydromethanopterin reductase
MSVRFGLRIPPCADVRDVAATARAAEEADFDVAWLPDSQFLWRDVWAAMALAATTTDRIALGTCVTQFETRHATVTAAAAATIDELAPGRTILGVGTGDSAIKTLGLTPTRLSAMREQIANCRALWTGEAVEFGGRVMTLRAKPPSGRLPIYMAATGPKALALAGEIADGVIVLAGVAPELIERSLCHIREGAARVGRDIAGVDICLGTFCHLTDDEREAARIVKPYACTLAQIGGTDALELAGSTSPCRRSFPRCTPTWATRRTGIWRARWRAGGSRTRWPSGMLTSSASSATPCTSNGRSRRRSSAGSRASTSVVSRPTRFRQMSSRPSGAR